MIIYILGFLDLWTGLLLFPAHFGWISYHVIAVHSMYLFAKGILFWGEFYSLLDVMISVYLLLMALGLTNMIVTILAALYLLQKALFTFRY